MKRYSFCLQLCAILLCVCLCMAGVQPQCLAAPREALPLESDLDELREQYKRDKGLPAGGFTIDYSYYSPVGEEDTNKYPLVIFLSGAFEGAYAGKELYANDFACWSSREYQARFGEPGGAFLMIARSAEEAGLFWDSSLLTSALKAAIDDFIDLHENVDTSRIYLVSWCLGVSGATLLASAYPGFFAAAVFMSSRYTLSDTEAQRMADLPVWVVACVNDTYSAYELYSAPLWNRMLAVTQNAANLRLTTFTAAPNTSVFFNHNVWLAAAHDLQYTGTEYAGQQTIDGEGNSIDLLGDEGMISWLGRQQLGKEHASCLCRCHKTGAIIKIFWKLLLIFQRFMGINKTCACGVAHY